MVLLSKSAFFLAALAKVLFTKCTPRMRSSCKSTLAPSLSAEAAPLNHCSVASHSSSRLHSSGDDNSGIGPRDQEARAFEEGVKTVARAWQMHTDIFQIHSRNMAV